jgi:hypothetical protein
MIGYLPKFARYLIKRMISVISIWIRHKKEKKVINVSITKRWLVLLAGYLVSGFKTDAYL